MAGAPQSLPRGQVGRGPAMAAAAGQVGAEQQVGAGGAAIIESLHQVGIASAEYDPY
jgi:hypothetical protein